MKKFFHIVILAAVAVCCACTSSVVRSDNVSSFTHDGFSYRVSFMSDTIAHIQVLPEGDTLVTQRLVVDRAPVGGYRCLETDDRIAFRTSEMEVVFDKAAGAFVFKDAETGDTLLAEAGRKLTQSAAGGENA